MADEQQPEVIGDDYTGVTDEEVLERALSSGAMEPFGGEDAMPPTKPAEPARIEPPEYARQPVSGNELGEYQALVNEYHQNVEYSILQAHPGIDPDRARVLAKHESDKFKYLPPYRGPDPDLVSRASRGKLSRVVGRRVIQMPKEAEEGEPPAAPMEEMITVRQRMYAQMRDMGISEQAIESWEGTQGTRPLEDVQSQGLYLPENPRATEEQLKTGAIVGGLVGGLTPVASAMLAGSALGPMGAVGAGFSALFGAGMGYAGTGVAFSYDKDEFWESVPLIKASEGEAHSMLIPGKLAAPTQLVAPRGLVALATRASVKSRAFDLYSWLHGQVDPDWAEGDKERMSRQLELADVGMNFDTMVSVQAAKDSVSQQEADANPDHVKFLQEQFRNQYLMLAPVDIPKQAYVDHRVTVERAIRETWPDMDDSWVRRQINTVTTVQPRSLRNVLLKTPLLVDREDLRSLQRAIGQVEAGADDDKIQESLDAVPFWELAEAGLLLNRIRRGGKQVIVHAMPSPESIAKSARAAHELRGATGGHAGEIMERAFGEMMLKRVKDNEKVGAVNVVESNFGRTMRVIMGLQELWLEAPIPYITPAGIDFAYGLGIRTIGSAYLDRVFAAVASGSGGLTWNQMALAHRAGWDRRSTKYAVTQNLAVLLDWIFPWEEFSAAVPISAGMSAHRMATIPRRLIPKGVPRTKMYMAMASPPAYRMYHKLVYGTDKAPKYADSYSVSNHVIMAMIKESVLSGNIHKSPMQKLIRSQLEVVAGRLGVEGGYEALEDLVMGVSRQTFGSMINSVNEIVERGTPTARGLRAGEGYNAVFEQIRKLSEEGIIEQDHVGLYMALMEIEGMRFAQDPKLPSIKTPEDYFNKVRHLVGGTPGPNARYSGIHPEVRSVGAETLGRVHAGEPTAAAPEVPELPPPTAGKTEAERVAIAKARSEHERVGEGIIDREFSPEGEVFEVTTRATRYGKETKVEHEQVRTGLSQAIRANMGDAAADAFDAEIAILRDYEFAKRTAEKPAAPVAEESLSFMHTLDMHSILRLGERLGIEIDSPAFQSKLEELGFAELPLHNQAGMALVYSAMQLGRFGGDPAKLPRAMDPKFEKSPLDYDEPSVGPITADMDLGELEGALIGSEMEHGAWVDALSGKQVGRRRGEVSHVPLEPEDYIRSSLHQNLIFTHVHPTGTPPSPGDIVGGMLGDSASIRAIGAPDGIGFVLDRPAGEAGWGPDWNLAERVRDKGAIGGWNEFAASGVVQQMDASLTEARNVGLMQAIHLYADDIEAATGSRERAVRFREVAVEYFSGIIGRRGYDPGRLEKHIGGESAYDAEAFKQRISERVVENYEDVLEEAGINARFRRTSAGGASQPGLRAQSDIGAISRELEGYREELAGAGKRIAEAPDAESIQKDMFGKKVDEAPEPEAPEPAIRPDPQEELATFAADQVVEVIRAYMRYEPKHLQSPTLEGVASWVIDEAEVFQGGYAALFEPGPGRRYTPFAELVLDKVREIIPESELPRHVRRPLSEGEKRDADSVADDFAMNIRSAVHHHPEQAGRSIEDHVSNQLDGWYPDNPETTINYDFDDAGMRRGTWTPFSEHVLDKVREIIPESEIPRAEVLDPRFEGPERFDWYLNQLRDEVARSAVLTRIEALEGGEELADHFADSIVREIVSAGEAYEYSLTDNLTEFEDHINGHRHLYKDVDDETWGMVAEMVHSKLPQRRPPWWALAQERKVAEIAAQLDQIKYEGTGQVEELPEGGIEETIAFKNDIERQSQQEGLNMYKAGWADVTIKELVQNAWDGVDGSMYLGEMSPGEGRIDVTIDHNDRSITVADNGSGMLRDVVKDAFFTASGSYKGDLPPGRRSGGYGKAKMGFLFGSRALELVTVRNGQKTVARVTPDIILSGKIKIKTTQTTEPNGTSVKAWAFDEYVEYAGKSHEYKAEVQLPSIDGDTTPFFTKPLIGDVQIREHHVTRENWGEGDVVVTTRDPGKVLGRDFDADEFKLWTTATFDWGEADIYVGNTKLDKISWTSRQVLSAGVWQFDRASLPLMGTLPYHLIFDVKPNVDTIDGSYPFNMTREEYRSTILADIQAMEGFLAEYGHGLEAAETSDVFKTAIPMERVNLDDLMAGGEQVQPRFLPETRKLERSVEIEEIMAGMKPAIRISEGEVKTSERQIAESFEAKKEFKTAKDFIDTVAVDPKRPLFHNNTTLEIPESAEPMLAKIGSIIVEFKERMAKVPGYGGLSDPMKPYASGISLDKTYEGVHIRVPYRAFFLNPLMNVAKSDKGVVGAWWSVLIHEATHMRKSGHGDPFVREEINIHTRLADLEVEEPIKRAMRRVLDEHWDDYKALRDSYEQFGTKNVAKSLEPGEKLPAEGRAGVRDRLPGAKGDDGGAPRGRLEQVEGGPERGAEPGPREPEPTAADIIYSNVIRPRGVEPEAPAAAKLPETPEEINEAFKAMSDVQRYEGPEQAAMRIRESDVRVPEYGHQVEHIGDLLHRMGKKGDEKQRGYGTIRGKIHGMAEQIGGFLTHRGKPYSLLDGMKSQHAREVAAGARSDKWADVEAELRRLGQEYADEHRKIPVYNEVQRLANDAAVALGEFRFEDAGRALKKLDDYLDEGVRAWAVRASRIEPEFARPGVAEAERVGLTYLERAHDGGYRTIHADVAKLDADWAKDSGFYVPRREDIDATSGKGKASIAKLDRFLAFARSGQPIEVPRVSLGPDAEKPVGFSDGRHRFAALRDQGETTVPVQVPAENALEFATRYGVEPGMMKPPVESRGPSRLLVGISGARGEFPEVGIRYSRYRALLRDLKKLDEQARTKQGGRYTEMQLNARDSIHAELDQVLTEVYNIFKPDLNRVLTENAHPDDIQLGGVRGPDLDEGGLPGWGGEPGQPFVQLELGGDLTMIRGRLSQFSKAYKQESLVIRESTGSSDLPEGYLDDVSAPISAETVADLLFNGPDGGPRAPTMRIELNDRIMARPELADFLRVAELEQAGIALARSADSIELVYLPEMSSRPVSPAEFLTITRHAVAALSDFAEANGLGTVAAGHIRENIYVNAPEGGRAHGAYEIKGYDDAISEGLQAEDIRHTSRAGFDVSLEEGVKGSNLARSQTANRGASDKGAPGRGTDGERLPDPTPARHSEVVRDLTPELGRHLDIEGGKPHEAVGKAIGQRLDQSGLSKDAIDEAKKRLQPDKVAALKVVSQKVELELSLPDDPNGPPRSISFNVRFVRTDRSVALVPGGTEGTFSFPDLDYVTRRPIMLDPKFNLQDIENMPGKDASRLRKIYKSAGIPEDIIDEALGFTMPEDRVYSNADIAAVMRAASEAYEDLTIALYRKHLNSMGTTKYRPEAPEAGATPSQAYLDRLNVHAVDQLGILILAMTSAGTNITENQLLTAAIRPRTRAQLKQTANLIRESRGRKRAWFENRAKDVRRFTPEELEGQDLDALSKVYVEVGLPRDAAEQLVGRGEAVYGESVIDAYLDEARAIYEDLSREEAQYLVGLAITAGSKADAKYIHKGILAEVRGGGFRKWWEPGTPFQAWEWDTLKKLNEKAYRDARVDVIGRMDRIELEMDTARQDIDADKALLKTEKAKARKTSIRKRIKQSEAGIKRRELEYESLREFLRYTAGEFIPSSPVARLTEGFVARSQIDPRLIADLLVAFDEDLARVESGKQQYLWFEPHPDEMFDEFIMRVQSSTRGMGTKTSSFALSLTDPANSNVAAIDVHMIRKYWRSIIPDASKRVRDWYKMWKQGRGESDPGVGASKQTIATRQDVDFKDYFENYSSDWVARTQATLAPRPVKVRARGIEIDVGARRKELTMARAALSAGRTAGVGAKDMRRLGRGVERAESLLNVQRAVTKWDKLYPDHPLVQAIKDGEARVTTDAYTRAVNVIRNDPTAKDAGLSTFGAQWLRWDQIRRYYEPEMTVAPGASSIPGQSAAALMELRRELAELHFFRNAGKTSLDPEVRLYSHEPGVGHRIMFSGDPEAPRGAFEIDQTTGDLLIRMFKTGDIGVLFHENGHLLEAILGAQWRDDLYSHYPTKVYPELIEQDLIAGMGWWEFPGRRLTPEASEQIAEAWKWFLLTRIGPGGPVRRKFVELYRTMQDYWLRVRNQPDVLSGRMVDLFDAYFRPTDVAAAGAVGLVAASREARMPRVNLDADMGRRWNEGGTRKAQQKMSWERIDTRELHLRQAMDLPEDVTEVDAIDLFSKMYAYVATEQIRKLSGPTELVGITVRSHVPASRLKSIDKQVRDRTIYYMQLHPKEVAKLVTTEVRDGVEFEVYELNEAQAAGFKRMVEDMAGEPMGNIIYARMLEPDYDYSRPTPTEYNNALEVMNDVVAGAGSRKTGYSERISPSMGYAVWNMFKSAVNNLADDKRWRVVEGSRDWIRSWFSLGEELSQIDPIVRTLLQGGARRMADAPDWVRRRAREIARAARAEPGHEGPTEQRIHAKIINELRESLEWPIHPSKIWLDESKTSPLLDMRSKFKDLKRVEDNRRRRWDSENPDKFPNADEYADFTTEELFADLDQIKMLLREEGNLLPEPVAIAIDTLEIYKKRLRTQSLEDLNEFEQFEFGGAIDDIHYALDKKVEVAREKAYEIASSISGSEKSGLYAGLSLPQEMQLYHWFFNGKLEELIDFVSQRGYHTGLEKDRMSRIDMSEVMLEMIIRMKATQEFNRLLEDLTRYNLRFDVRDLDSAKQFGPNFDKAAYAERVKHYLSSTLAGDRSTRNLWRNRKRVATIKPNAPDPSNYPKRDRVPGPLDGADKLHDMRAYLKAMEIIDLWGIGTFSGKWETFTAPDGTEIFIPSAAKEHLQSAIDRAAGVGNTYGRSSLSKKFLPERRGLPLKDPKIAEKIERDKDVIAWSAVGKTVNWLWNMNPITAARIKMGVTTGIIIPNAAYYVSVGVGAWFQMYQGLGLLRSITAAFPTRMTFAVVARLFKEGGYRPNAPAIVTNDGRIYTSSMLAEMAQRYGLNQSFIKIETVGAIADDIAKMTPSGVLDRITSGFSGWQDTLIESATAIDNYFRVGTFISELKRGASPDAAASLARKVGYDYSALTDFERKSMRDIILFYSYMRKNQDLFWDTVLTHPSRVINQARLMRGIQQVNLEEDPEIVLPEYLKGRLPVYFRDIGKQTHLNRQVMFILPPLPFTDAVGLWVDVLGSAEAMTSAARDTEHLRGMMSRLTPWIQAGPVFMFNEDIFFERDLDKYNRVPAFFVEADYMLTGGMVVEDILDIDDQPMYEPLTEDFPGLGFYHARNGKYWWVLRRLIQTPGFGRSMDVIESLDRSNIGAVEIAMEGLRTVRMHGVRHGYLDYPRPARVKLPSDISPDLAGPRAGELSGPEELSAFFGVRPIPIAQEDVMWARYLRRHSYDVKDQIKKEEEGDIYTRR